MKERQILFSAPMVRSILEDRKTQTRRVIKPQPIGFTGRNYIVPDHAPKSWHDSADILSFCPYGQPGDRLWVRETWGKVQMRHLMSPTPGRVEEAVTYRAGRLVFRSEDRPPSGSFEQWPSSWSDDYPPSDGRWRPSIHMPRWASRILLEVIGIRVERLQEITTEDARAEGCQPPDLPPEIAGVAGDYVADERTSFAILWNRINGPGSWDDNLWVWVVEFKRIEQEAP